MGIQPLFKEIFVPDKKVRRRAAGLGGCGECRLYQDCLSPRMPPTGEGRKGILVLAEAPGEEEDKRGTQLIGTSGSLLRAELRKLGIDLDRDCRKMNAVNCHPLANKTPTDIQIACCRMRIMQEISTFKPRVILALGLAAMKSLCQHRGLWEHGFPGISSWHGAVIPDQELKCWIVPTYHPAYILRMEDNPIYEMKWREDLLKAKNAAEGPGPVIRDYRKDVEVILSPSAAASRIKALNEEFYKQEKPVVSFDYETTGLKPYLDGHKCVCVSFGWKTESGVRALCVPTVDETWPAIADILRDTRIGKCAHNMKFEGLWSRIRGYPALNGFRVRNWEWDAMLAAHILDNRPQYVGLKFQTYINFGVLGYDDDVAPYIKTVRKGANSINNIDDAPKRQLFLYCAYDSLFEYLLMEKQKPEILNDTGLRRAYKLLHDGALALTDVEVNGIVVDLDYCKNQQAHLTRQIDYLNQRILKYEEVRNWQKMAGKAFNLASPKQLRDLLVKRLKLSLDKKTNSGLESVDKTVLEDIDLPFVKDLLRIRKLEKIKSTYIEGFLSEAPDGLLHTFYHLHKVVSFRGSCSDLNFEHRLEVVKPCEFREQPDRSILIQALAARMYAVIEGATTISKESTSKWTEAHGCRFEKSAYDIV